MKIHFDNVNLSSRSGPNSFAKRLAHELIERSHQVILGDGSSADVSLVFIERSGAPLSPRVVQRLDGIWFSPQEYSTKNAGIKSLYGSADHVIWQSTFDMSMSTRHWGHPRRGSVVRNGIPNYTASNRDVMNQLEELKKRHEMILVSSANWHPQKRLGDNIRVFQRIKQFHPTACLIVMGSNAHPQDLKDIYWAGSLPHEACLQVFREADWMIHMAWLDHCPNTVVEALSCSVPVICTEDGGTKELVGDFGMVLRETRPYDFSLIDYNTPPAIDIESQILESLPLRNTLGMPPDVSIATSASKYLNIFKELVGNNS